MLPRDCFQANDESRPFGGESGMNSSNAYFYLQRALSALEEASRQLKRAGRGTDSHRDTRRALRKLQDVDTEIRNAMNEVS